MCATHPDTQEARPCYRGDESADEDKPMLEGCLQMNPQVIQCILLALLLWVLVYGVVIGIRYYTKEQEKKDETNK